MNYLVYWAKLPDHDDVYSQGYVGITKDFKERIRSHKKNKKKCKLREAIKKYGTSIQWTVLHDNLDINLALRKEKHYRPLVNIGWNHDVGGEIGVNPNWYNNYENKEKHSRKTAEKTKLGIKIKDSPLKRSKRAKFVWEREGYRENRKSQADENNSQWGKKGEAHPAYGYKHTDTARKRISIANKNKIVSDITQKKLSRIAKTRWEDDKYRKKVTGRTKNEQEKIFEDREKDRVRRRTKKLQSGFYQDERARASKLTNLQRREICEMRLKGFSYKKISENFPVGLTGIKAVCDVWGKKNGYDFYSSPIVAIRKQKYSDEVKERVCKMYKNGNLMIEVSSKMNIPETTVYTIISEWGPIHGYEYKKK